MELNQETDTTNTATISSLNINENKAAASSDIDKKMGEVENRTFYLDAAKYWSHVEPTTNGMLGGLGYLNNNDIKDSERFLKTLAKLKDAPGNSNALDCGSGIGRITKNLLQRFFAKVDLVDQDPKFIEEASRNFEGNDKIGKLTCCGLQKFVPELKNYDVIWIQWVLSYLTDDDLIDLIHRCCRALRLNGIMVIKENCTGSNTPENDSEDSSVTRGFSCFMEVFKKADVKVIKYVKQKNFPKELYPVWMFAIKPHSYD